MVWVINPTGNRPNNSYDKVIMQVLSIVIFAATSGEILLVYCCLTMIYFHKEPASGCCLLPLGAIRQALKYRFT